MFCSKCGAQIADDTFFCPKCGNKMGETSNPVSEPIIKSKKECIYEGICAYLKKMPSYMTASFGDLENYEDGAEGKVYTEIVVYARDMFGRTKATRFGAVINAVEADGNCVFAAPGPQMINLLLSKNWAKLLLGFKRK